MSRVTAAERTAIESRRVEKVYAVLAGVYDDIFDWALGPGRRQAVAALNVRPGDRVLEIGVGTGLSLPHYPAGCRVTGIDISEPMLEQAKERAEGLGGIEVDLRLMDARHLDLPDAAYDHVLAPYVISVVPEPDRVMQEIRRVCRPGGTVVVLNQFLSTNPVLRVADRLLTPLSRWVGFHMDVPVEVVTRVPGLRVAGLRRVNLLRLWSLIHLEREA